MALVDSTSDKYQTLKRRVEGELTRSNPQYQALLKDRAAVDQELAAARRDPATPYQTYQDLYAKKEKSGNTMRDMVDTAMDQAGGATARRLDRRLQGPRRPEEKPGAQVESSPQVAAAKQKAAQSQQSVDQLATKLAGSQAAYDEASYQQGKQDDYNYHHQGDSLDYWDNTGWYGYRGVAVYRGGRVWGRR